MLLYKSVLFVFLCIKLMSVESQIINVFPNSIEIDLTAEKEFNSDFHSLLDRIIHIIQKLLSPETYNTQDRVKVEVFFESQCPHCRNFMSTTFNSTVFKLSENMDIYINPYGNANTTIDNGTYKIECQHGPTECYGNTLHACAIDYLGNITKAISFSACMISPSQPNGGSNDAVADECGELMDIDTTEIKQCAKGPKGLELLQRYGVDSKKAGYKHVPHILINGEKKDGSNFMEDICAALSYLPPPCKNRV